MNLPVLSEYFEENHFLAKEVSQINPCRIQNGIWVTIKPKETLNRKNEERISLPIIQNQKSNSYNKVRFSIYKNVKNLNELFIKNCL